MAGPSLSTSKAQAASDAHAVLPAAAADAEFGFQRPDFGKEKLAGTVELHERHVFLCYKGPQEWPSVFEATDAGSLPGLLAAAIEARKSELKETTMLTICEEDGTGSSCGDVLVFPDMLRYRGLTHSSVDSFVEEVLVNDIEWLAGSCEAVTGSYLFVCAHGTKDKRCGVCGPVLIARFKEEIAGKHPHGQVAISSCSDVGGHKYAGHVIIFSSDAKGEVSGHCYGYVSPDQVPVLLQKHVLQGEIVNHLWRGQLCISKQMKKALVCAQDKGLGYVTEGRLFIPAGINDDTVLHQSEVHGFRTARQLKDAVNKSKKWLSTKMSAGLLTNGAIFAVQSKDVSDASYEVSGVICLLHKEEVSQIKPTYRLYTTKNLTEPLKERQVERVGIGEIFILRCDLGGNRWMLRKFSIEGDDGYQILQWLPRVPDNEYPLKKSAHTTKKITQHEDGYSIVNSIAMIEEMIGLSNSEKAKAIVLVKAEENQVILASIKSNDLRMSWLREEIKNQEKILVR